jgi:hypothetical protein
VDGVFLRPVLPVLLLLLSACSPDTDTPRGVAEAFLDQHYVRMDLPAAAAHCTGLARHKVDDEIRLKEGQEIDASTQKPSVSYALEEERTDDGERHTFLFRGKVRLSGGDTFDMHWMVNVKRADGVWKVSNFKEMQ